MDSRLHCPGRPQPPPLSQKAADAIPPLLRPILCRGLALSLFPALYLSLYIADVVKRVKWQRDNTPGMNLRFQLDRARGRLEMRSGQCVMELAAVV
ncbi:uncharacterized protein J3R85_010968 [Psidium guajava]|nr:uncharacterized protein J3R85_010968 [Psidium guajava]